MHCRSYCGRMGASVQSKCNLQKCPRAERLTVEDAANVLPRGDREVSPSRPPAKTPLEEELMSVRTLREEFEHLSRFVWVSWNNSGREQALLVARSFAADFPSVGTAEDFMRRAEAMRQEPGRLTQSSTQPPSTLSAICAKATE